MSNQYTDIVEIARAIRARLRETYPGDTFSVRTSRFSGGASVRIAWLDGPCERAVRETLADIENADQYRAAYDLHGDYWTGSHYWHYERAYTADLIENVLDALDGVLETDARAADGVQVHAGHLKIGGRYSAWTGGLTSASHAIVRASLDALDARASNPPLAYERYWSGGRYGYLARGVYADQASARV